MNGEASLYAILFHPTPTICIHICGNNSVGSAIVISVKISLIMMIYILTLVNLNTFNFHNKKIYDLQIGEGVLIFAF